MASVVRSIGYGVGKLHTGLIRYLCELWNEGASVEVQPFFDALGVRLPDVTLLRPTVEEKGIDLVIRGDLISGGVANLAMIEMKVDDHENEIRLKKREKKDHQTNIYPQLRPGFSTHLFVTLGVGEHYAPPQNALFKWIRLRDFANAVASIRLKDPVVRDWKEMLDAEIKLSGRAATATRPPDKTERIRTGVWSLYLLGSIKDRLQKTPELSAHASNAKAYFYGSRPDTILNFGGKPYFAEINYRGRLNLKVHLSHLDRALMPGHIASAQQRYRQLFRDAGLDPCLGSPKVGKSTKKTKMLMSFDVGLRNSGSGLCFSDTPNYTCRRIAQILTLIYSTATERA